MIMKTFKVNHKEGIKKINKILKVQIFMMLLMILKMELKINKPYLMMMINKILKILMVFKMTLIIILIKKNMTKILILIILKMIVMK